MKRLSLQFLGFCIVPILFLFFVFLFFQRELKRAELSSEIKVVFCGDSRIESGLNPDLYPNAINISNSAESFFFTYYSLKQLLQRPNAIQHIYLGCTYHSFTEQYDKFIFDSEKTHWLLPNYLSILDAQGLSYVLRNPLQLCKQATTSFRKMFQIGIKGEKNVLDYPFIGKFYQSTESNINDSLCQKKINEHFYKNEVLQQQSAIQNNYFAKIVHLCAAQNVKLTLLNMPLHLKYRERVPSFIKNEFETKMKNVSVHYWDFTDVPFADSLFGDVDHLNAKGAIEIADIIMRYNKIGPQKSSPIYPTL